MEIALVQVASPPQEPVAERIERVGALVRGQARGADLVVLPELWSAGYFAFNEYEARAESLTDGPTVTAGRVWARELGAHIALGSVVERSEEGLHNTAVVLGPDGSILHSYRKMHVFGYASREAELLSPGHVAGVFDAPWGLTGATTCYDLRFPELYRVLIDQGAQGVIVPAAWPAARLEHWRLFTTVRAVEEQVLLIACNSVGVQAGDVRLAGHSRVVDPWGEVLVEAGDEEQVVTCSVDPQVVDAVRSRFPALSDRRLNRATGAAPTT
ncbi:carbon-nitrogen family hydrolase [Actinomycetospora lutea]|uniref:carbon-nitrogen family hydrolase n=1 Tax=Actinomycetospora lutea TaxID=663604 RepID=UPI0023671525|nr:carbon-nitrogen family hydrolase [Actinomycetospora lutea]MDD7942833.1 carbon-nitrogen family hydrolase [Actinomycetospora lutea]